MKERINEKEEIPQICQVTGLSMDYINELASIISLYNFGGISSLIQRLEKRPFNMKKYEEVYANYRNVINDKNRESIKKLNTLTDQINEILKDPTLINENSFRKIVNEICFLIYGDTHVSI